jgi:FkbM family methyltransferase
MNLKQRLRINSTARTARERVLALQASLDSPFRSIISNIEELELQNVFDVGANVGQFGLDLRRSGFKGQIFSFEPIGDTFLKLNETVRRRQPWQALQLGLGSSVSEKEIYVSGNAGLSSSFLKMNRLHLENFPDSNTVAIQKVAVSTLDRQFEELGVDPNQTLLKLDVQGFETEALKGAAESLSKIPLCYLEVSILPLYTGEITFLPILLELSKFGHHVIDVFRGIKAKDGRLLQLDILTKLSKV